MLREPPNVPTQTLLRLDNQLKAGFGRVMMMMMMMMAGKKKSYGTKLRNWPVAHLRLALCSLGTLYTRHSHSPAGTLHIMRRPATLYMGCSQDVPLALCTCVIVLAHYTLCSPGTFYAGTLYMYVVHNVVHALYTHYVVQTLSAQLRSRFIWSTIMTII